ncbi:GTP-binding protein [Cutaneotrichosporon oleaginosum]|uniref:GTP-binding protein n=1 Tax=Cutaneotrichosporon oleaginosum TaxID=879819 RepID=A0A0J0XEQ6_9TREE|nr:GTP-binding protein [Cutaneotrichosporon oleaginosum]KLT39546.1 GTP-binding protein [Cutaneotrichosporon oleaginosum]
MRRTKPSGAGLGKALINRKAKEAYAPKESQLYSLDDNNPLASVTHERDLDEFLANAALADHDFTTERSKIRIIQQVGGVMPQANPYLLSDAEEKRVEKKQEEARKDLHVPRRPPWTRATTRQELEKQERESFLDWRRQLAHLAEDSSLLLTPFERNIQLWRQLWRVIERSHLVVQIVDARNPLGFRCADLEEYVLDVGSEEMGDETTVPGKGKRRNLLLINKSDLLTYEQRCMWADHFEKIGIKYAFFSAVAAAAAQEELDAQERREEDSDYGSEDDSASEADEEDKEAEDNGVTEDDEDYVTESDEEPISKNKGKQRATVEDEDIAEDVAEALKQTTLEEAKQQKPAGPAQPESDRTRVLSVAELEHLFISSAPPLSDFATERDPNPSKLMIGLVGYPNVGKSSTINALIGAKKVSVSATPGKTKHFQTLVLTEDITLCDCPGLVFPQFANTQADLVCDGVLPIDQMREYSAPVDLVCRRIPRAILEGTYGIRIDVKEIEDGGTGKVGWEELLSAYAIARGMTRSSFGMPDTSRAARYVLKDYVNAKLLYARPPPGIDSDEFMSTSHQRTLEALAAQYAAGRKMQPETHVRRNADTFIAPSGASTAASATMEDERQERERAPTVKSVRQSAATAPMRSGKVRAAALDNYFFTESGPAPRPVVKGRSQGAADASEGGLGFSRAIIAPHQRRLGPDGMPLLDEGPVRVRNNGKKHYKIKEGKKRSGRGYD